MSVFFQNLYQIFHREAIGIMFGSVNNSIWEISKTLILPYFLWSMIELLILTTPFRKFVLCKTLAIYFLTLTYIFLCLIFSVFSPTSTYLTEFILAVISASVTAFLFCKAFSSSLNPEHLFVPSVFMLLLLATLFFSLTPFPPRLFIFMDRTTQLYGIIPENIDQGAIVLDTMYSF